MDISDISDDDFNAVQWINSNFKNFTNENSISDVSSSNKNIVESHVNNKNGFDLSLEFISSYVTKLQLYVQQINYEIEESIQQVVTNMPRVMKEAKVLQIDVHQLQQQMYAMCREVAQVKEETGSCMATVERLNSLQIKLQQAKESLQESDGWGNLIADLEEYFEKNDLKGVCDKIVALQKSLLAQEQLPGHVDRQTQVDDFKNRLEALASPNIVQCFIDGNMEYARHYIYIFIAIQRKTELLQHYRAAQIHTLQQQWKQTLELHVNETNDNSFLSSYYDQLLENCKRQVKWCNQVFEDTETQYQPFIVLIELLPRLQPTRDAHILQQLKICNERLEILHQYSRDNNAFVYQLNAYLEQASIQLSNQIKQELSTSIYEYFFKFIQQYPRLEETQLSTRLDRLLINQPHASEAVRHLKDNTSKLFDWLMEALERCASITEDLALCPLINLLGTIFKRLLEQFTKTQRQITLMMRGNSNKTTTSSENNWSMLQYTLALLECLIDFRQRLHTFEKYLYERLNALDKILQMTNNESKDHNIIINIYQAIGIAERKSLVNNISTLQSKRFDAQTDRQDEHIINSTNIVIFCSICESIRMHCIETHDITLEMLVQPMEQQLTNILSSEIHYNHMHGHMIDMPTFSFTPQEYITQIGQYLLTLPQHLEPLLLNPSNLLKQSLEICNVKYSQSSVCSADVLLSLVVSQFYVIYQKQILQLKTLTTTTSRQLAVDIEYLANVVEELGLTVSTSLKQIQLLLNCSSDDYQNLSVDCEPRLVSAIRQMRNIYNSK